GAIALQRPGSPSQVTRSWRCGPWMAAEQIRNGPRSPASHDPEDFSVAFAGRADQHRQVVIHVDLVSGAADAMPDVGVGNAVFPRWPRLEGPAAPPLICRRADAPNEERYRRAESGQPPPGRPVRARLRASARLGSQP